jgi:hypothetical protein
MDDILNPEARAKQVEDEEKEYKRLEKRKISDTRKVLQLPEGRRLLTLILSEGGLYRSSFSGDPQWTAFNEGKRDITLFITDLINKAKPEALTQMMREYKSELVSRNKEKN